MTPLFTPWRLERGQCGVWYSGRLIKKCSFVQSHHNGDCTFHSDGQRWLISFFITDTKKYFYPKHSENVCVDHVFVHSCCPALQKYPRSTTLNTEAESNGVWMLSCFKMIGSIFKCERYELALPETAHFFSKCYHRKAEIWAQDL